MATVTSEPPRRRLPRDQRRRIIEEAAETVFAERGYAGARLTDIATAAGVSRQLMRKHFATKRDLHLALLTRHRDELLAALATATDHAASTDRIAATTDAWFGYVEQHPYVTRLLFADTTGDAETSAFHERMRDEARGATAAALRADPGLALPDDLVEPTAELIRAATVGLALWWADHPEHPRERIVASAVGLWRDGLLHPRR